MSDQQEQNPSQQEDQEENSEEENDEEQDQDEENQDEQDQQEGDQDQDDQDQQNEDEQDEQEEQGEEGEEEKEAQNEKLPKFRQVQTQEFKFSSLLSQISSLSMNVDHFIKTLPSHGGSSYYRSSYVPNPIQYKTPTISQIPIPRQQPKIVVMKDEDVQVSMQPQIIIQPTKVEKPQIEPTYKISNESNKFLAQLYEQNKKLKRWQNSSHNLNTYNNGSSVSGFYGSRQRFQRQQYEKGLFNVQQRNKEIDQAIQLLKRQQQ